jgi:hypothetical protein
VWRLGTKLVQKHSLGMEGASPIRADTKILVALFVIGLTASLPFGALYWLMRPTILPNPGLISYQASRPDPVVPRVAGGVEESYTLSIALSIAAAKRENELLNANAKSAFAAARDAKPAAEAASPSAVAQQKRQRSARTRSLFAHEQETPVHSSALRGQAFGTWYR